MKYIVCIDLFFTILILVKFTPKNQIILIVLFLMTYYIDIVGLSHLFGIIDYEQMAAVNQLRSKGMDIPADFCRYQLILVVFKNVLMFFLLLKDDQRQKINWESIDSEGHNISTATLGVAVLGCVGLLLLTHRGFFGIGFRFLGVIFIIHMLLCKRLRENITLLILALIAIIYISFMVTRSRTVVAIIMLYLFAYFVQKYGTFSFPSLALLVFTLVTIALYAEYRNVDTRPSGSELIERITSRGVETRGEAGIVFVIGSHVAGLADYDLSGTFLADTIFSKIWRAIPLAPGKSDMLAVQYVEEYWPSVYDKGGGFAFSGIAESFLYGSWKGDAYAGRVGSILGGWACVILYAYLLSCALKWLILRAGNIYWRVLTLFVLVHIVRSEVSLIMQLMLYGACWIWLLKSLEFLKRKRMDMVNRITIDNIAR